MKESSPTSRTRPAPETSRSSTRCSLAPSCTRRRFPSATTGAKRPACASTTPSTPILIALLLAVAVWATALTVRRRPWDAAMVAVAPGMVLASTVNWDLWAVAAVSLALLAWARRYPVLAGAADRPRRVLQVLSAAVARPALRALSASRASSLLDADFRRGGRDVARSESANHGGPIRGVGAPSTGSRQSVAPTTGRRGWWRGTRSRSIRRSISSTCGPPASS